MKNFLVLMVILLLLAMPAFAGNAEKGALAPVPALEKVNQDSSCGDVFLAKEVIPSLKLPLTAVDVNYFSYNNFAENKDSRADQGFGFNAGDSSIWEVIPSLKLPNSDVIGLGLAKQIGQDEKGTEFANKVKTLLKLPNQDHQTVTFARTAAPAIT